MTMALNALDLLERAGWRHDREIDADPVVQRLRASGYTAVPPLRDFLTQFFGLVITSEDGSKSITFDLDSVEHLTDAEFCNEYGDAIGRPVTPVGVHSDMIIMIDAAGEFWAALDLDYGYMGKNIEQAVQWILIDPATMHMFDRRLPD
ncbi:SUKH-3 domain-containing protein [Cellulomonas sp. JZ18]|uniref:SUKH-3 domain-containing protein n=1 Tax=Cellulomonas sp. JZ18 TaxID=2654191 RepID=UPI0018AFA647|nr:SUKH-3 domain-containing protein [Cellulomonas sp. JZ18]